MGWYKTKNTTARLPVHLGALAPYEKGRAAIVGGVKISVANSLAGAQIIYSMHGSFRTLDGILC